MRRPDNLCSPCKDNPRSSGCGSPTMTRTSTRRGLLLLDTAELKKTLDTIEARSGFLAGLAADPTLRGLMTTIAKAMEAAEGKEAEFEKFVAPLGRLSTTIDEVLAGKKTQLSWQLLFKTDPATVDETRRLVLIYPALDYNDLKPGEFASAEVRRIGADIGITPANDLKLRLTGLVPLSDEEFATVAENYQINIGGTLIAVAVILYLALRSYRIIIAILATMTVGLVLTAGVGLAMIGELNLISVAFAVLFIGLSVDFSIQFATRYREERHTLGDLKQALTSATRHIGRPLTLAALSLVAGFFCFLPTKFHGVSELGLISGVGMIIAFIATMTFLPALLVLLKPHAEDAADRDSLACRRRHLDRASPQAGAGPHGGGRDRRPAGADAAIVRFEPDGFA